MLPEGPSCPLAISRHSALGALIHLVDVCAIATETDGVRCYLGSSLRTLRRYLKSAGRIAVIDPIDQWPPFHRRMKYTLDELDGWMQEAGYRRVEKHDIVPHCFFVIYEVAQ